MKNCPMCNKLFNAYQSSRPNIHRIYCSRQCLLDDKEYKFKKKQPGGYRKGSGIGKSGWYKNIWCDSSYELAYVIYCLDHGIKIVRNKQKYEYEDRDGNIRHYIPDFIVNDNLIEIKGYKEENFHLKMKACKNIKVLFKKDLNEVFDYVFSIYGKNYIELYES